MGDNTHIEWTDATWNPVSGCAKVSAGCKHCYAEREWPRLANNPKTPRYNGRAFANVRCHPEMLDQPLRWRKARRIFVNSMSDLFHEDVPFEFLDKVFAVMALCPRHTFQVLTKRPERMLDWFQSDPYSRILRHADQIRADIPRNALALQIGVSDSNVVSYRNVWLGVTAENQEAANERIPLLLQTPAAVRFVSVEPMVGPADITWALSRNRLDIAAGFLQRGHFSPGLETLHRLDWVICGGESGPKARPMHPDWARSLRDQCAAAGVPFLLKQLGEWSEAPQGSAASTLVHDFADGVRVFRVGKKAAGRLLDGREHLEYPNQ